jgi:hypothetical protein
MATDIPISILKRGSGKEQQRTAKQHDGEHDKDGQPL